MGLTAFLHQHLPRVWLRRGLVAWALRPVAAVYGGLIALRRLGFAMGLFKTQRVPALVIVVGNVVAGGAGKTPVTIALAKHLLARGFKVGVISRGHGRQTRDTRAVTSKSKPLDVGDEPLLIQQATGAPVWVGRARADAAMGLLQAHPQVQILLCDDGLQHLALARDLEICVMDERGIGNGWLLPAGPLRETWPQPVDAVLHTGPQVAALGAGAFHAPRQLADHALTADGQHIPLQSLTQVHAPSLHAVAALARPEAFFEMLRQSGLHLASTTALPDHHHYQDWPAQPEKTWLCTEKDAAKLWAHEPGALAVPLVVTPESGFWNMLDTRIDELLERPIRHGIGLAPGCQTVIIGPMDTKLLELLVCPVTKGPLNFDRERHELLSRSARLAYRVRNGIPILLENEARTLSDEEIDQLAALRPAL